MVLEKFCLESPQWLLLVCLFCSYRHRLTYYSCFNAFSRVDVRVDVKIPGGVNAYVIDLRGERCVRCMTDSDISDSTTSHDATPEIWQETYLSALLRSILYADDPNYRLMGFRKLDPITSPEAELRFLQAADSLFTKGAFPSLVYTYC
jgi:Chs5-Arf1p-binding protein BUD7/BCH1